MTLHLIAVLVALAEALACAAELGGALGGGVVLGYLLGAAMSGLAFLYQRHVLATRPERALAALVAGFLAKLVALLLGALAFRYVEPAAVRADWRSFVIAYGAAVALVVPLATWAAVQEQRRRIAARAVKA
jgi:hypothetical protein